MNNFFFIREMTVPENNTIRRKNGPVYYLIIPTFMSLTYYVTLKERYLSEILQYASDGRLW